MFKNILKIYLEKLLFQLLIFQERVELESEICKLLKKLGFPEFLVCRIECNNKFVVLFSQITDQVGSFTFQKNIFLMIREHAVQFGST